MNALSWADLNQMIADRDRELAAERALADDLAAVLEYIWAKGIPEDETPIDTVLARYREARQR